MFTSVNAYLFFIVQGVHYKDLLNWWESDVIFITDYPLRMLLNQCHKMNVLVYSDMHVCNHPEVTFDKWLPLYSVH